MTHFACPDCGSERFYLIRREVSDVEALEMVANGTSADVANLRRFLLPLRARCSDCGQFDDSVTLIDHAMKIGATRWADFRVMVEVEASIVDNKEDSKGEDP